MIWCCRRPSTLRWHRGIGTFNVARSGRWIGVFDGSSLRLYVNGTLAAALGGVSGWTSPPSGPLRVGADLQAGGNGPVAADFWDGAVSDACVFYGALSGSDAGTLAAQGSDGCAAMHVKYG
jgi:hypothetical protein